MDFLNTTAPFHSSLLSEVESDIVHDLRRCKFDLQGCQLAFPVWSTDTNDNLQLQSNLGSLLVHQQLVAPVDWHAMLMRLVYGQSCSHIFDFGPHSLDHPRGITILSWLVTRYFNIRTIWCGQHSSERGLNTLHEPALELPKSPRWTRGAQMLDRVPSDWSELGIRVVPANHKIDSIVELAETSEAVVVLFDIEDASDLDQVALLLFTWGSLYHLKRVFIAVKNSSEPKQWLSGEWSKPFAAPMPVDLVFK